MLCVGMRFCTLCVLPLEQSQTCEIWVPPSRAEAPRQDADSHAPRATLSSRCSASGCGFARSACFPSSRARPARSGCHPPVPKLRVKMRTRTLCELYIRHNLDNVVDTCPKRVTYSRSHFKFVEAHYPNFITCTIVGWPLIFICPELVGIVFDSWRRPTEVINSCRKEAIRR
jgi:hypothetical protein